MNYNVLVMYAFAHATARHNIVSLFIQTIRVISYHIIRDFRGDK